MVSPGCLECVTVLGAGGCLIHQIKAYRDSGVARLKASLSQVCEKVLQRGLPPDQHATRRYGALPTGADTSIAAALDAVQRYQNSKSPPWEVDVPSCGPYPFRFGGQKLKQDPDVQTSLCQELKAWLLSSATGSVDSTEVSARTEYCYQMMMRPEVFNDAPFARLMGEVAEKLEVFSDRLASKARTCATELGEVLNHGRAFVDSCVPVLLLGIVSGALHGTLGHIDVEVMAKSADIFFTYGDTVGAPGRDDLFRKMWHSDVGHMLHSLLGTLHCRRLWGLDNDGEAGGPTAASGPKVLDAWLDVRHKWADAVDRNSRLDADESGILPDFCGREHKELQQSYLNVYKHVDNFILFLSVVEHYQGLSMVAGDAGMHYLRDGLHHLLRELDHSLMEVHQGLTSIAGEAKHKVAHLLAVDPNPAGKTKEWIERLQLIDDARLLALHKRLLDAIQHLHFLSAEARLPALTTECKDNLLRLADISASEEFRSRCGQLPPAAPLLLEAPLLALSALAAEPAEPMPLARALDPATEEEETANATTVVDLDLATTRKTPAAEQVAAPEATQEQSQPNATDGLANAEEAQVGAAGPLERNSLSVLGDAATFDSAEDEEQYYNKLTYAVLLPFFGSSDELTQTQLAKLLERAELPGTAVRCILECVDPRGGPFTVAATKRALWLAAVGQEFKREKQENLEETKLVQELRGMARLLKDDEEKTMSARYMPRLRGITYTRGRIQVTECF